MMNIWTFFFLQSELQSGRELCDWSELPEKRVNYNYSAKRISWQRMWGNTYSQRNVWAREKRLSHSCASDILSYIRSSISTALQTRDELWGHYCLSQRQRPVTQISLSSAVSVSQDTLDISCQMDTVVTGLVFCNTRPVCSSVVL